MSFESRYGMCLDLLSTRAEMTLPRAESERLILVASFSRSPVAPTVIISIVRNVAYVFLILFNCFIVFYIIIIIFVSKINVLVLS